jgi:DNA (cytosine-5)-methyltransferase 1
VNEELSPTLQTSLPGDVAKPERLAFGICSKGSYAMQSDNPKTGFYEAETSRTLDQGGGNPCCAQGGVCIVTPAPETYDVRFTSDGTKNTRGHCYKTDISRCLDTGGEDPDSNHGGVCIVEAEPTYTLQGSMIGRAEQNGPQGEGVNEEVCFTLNCSDRHAVAAPAQDKATYCATTGSFMTVEREKTNTLMARDYKDPQIINDAPNQEPTYIVRRLTPVECARLQGFPDWWCSDLAILNPNEGALVFWMEVWATWNKLNGRKPKTEAQVRKWLANPHSDSAEYKLWGNGISLPIVFFVLSGIIWAASRGD